MAADRTHWSECWRVHHECAVAEVERLRAQVADLRIDLATDPDGRLWRDRAHDCARDVREALGHERDAHIIWSQVVQMVREQRERTERLEAIVRELAVSRPASMGEGPGCDHCGADSHEPHDDDCRWRLAREVMGLGCSACGATMADVWGGGMCGRCGEHVRAHDTRAEARTKRLEVIVRGLVHLGPSDTYGSCLLCGTDNGAPHESDCLWLRARQEVGDVG